ncbi:MAG: metal-dependent hydrolase [Bacteroidota bacterium]|nr:metal-dependent hydrolase [Bacteroidota bacterium]
MKVTYYGHSCFSVLVEDKVCLFDPFITPNKLAEHIDIKTIKPDVILISHGHEDHIANAVEMAINSGALVICMVELGSWLQKQGLDNLMNMNIGGNHRFDWGNVKMVKAVHSSSLPDGTYGGLAAGFIIESSEGSFYYSGDTAITLDFNLIGEWYDLDFAVLPIGDHYTMGSEDALLCAKFIGCNRIMGVHYDTFPEIMINKKEVTDQFTNAGKELILLEIGEERNI